MKRVKSEKGLLSLEASICLTIFIFLMLYLYSFFVVFEARNEMAHVLLATNNSMTLDIYENDKMGNSGKISAILYEIYGNINPNEDGFVSTEQWNQILSSDVDGVWNGTIYVEQTHADSDVTEEDDYGKQAQISSVLTNVIKERFVAYLAGGDLGEANRILEKYHIVGGIDGLDFSGTHIKSGKLYLSIRYTIEYEFNMFGLGELEMEQSCCSKLWK